MELILHDFVSVRLEKKTTKNTIQYLNHVLIGKISLDYFFDNIRDLLSPKIKQQTQQPSQLNISVASINWVQKLDGLWEGCINNSVDFSDGEQNRLFLKFWLTKKIHELVKQPLEEDITSEITELQSVDDEQIIEAVQEEDDRLNQIQTEDEEKEDSE